MDSLQVLHPIVFAIPAERTLGFLGLAPDAWVAIFTGLLFVATFLQGGMALRADFLTRQSLELTQRQARTARQAAIAALAVDLPNLLFLPESDILDSDGPQQPGGPYGGHPHNGYPTAGTVIDRLTIRNLGRSASDIVRLEAGAIIAPNLPEIPNFQSVGIHPIAGGIDAGKQETFQVTPIVLAQTIEQVAEAMIGQRRLWYFCRCTYLDFQNREHVRSAVWVWRVQEGGIHYRFEPDDDAPNSYKIRSDDYADF